MLRIGPADQRENEIRRRERTAMLRDEQIRIAKRLLAHIRNGTA